MNEFINQLSNRTFSQIVSLALGVTFALVGQQVVGQSIATPKVSPMVAQLQAELQTLKGHKEELAIRFIEEDRNRDLCEKELEELKKREAELSLSAESYPEVLKTLHSQRVQLSIDLAGIEARYDAIASAIKTAAAKQNNEVLKPFKRMVELRKARFDQMNKRESATGLEKRTAEIELLHAQLELARASKPSGSLSHLNSQLLNTSLERAEKSARLEKANSLYGEVEEYRDFSKLLSAAQKKRESGKIRRSNISSEQHRINSRIAKVERDLERELKK